jgi:hypothetical protein
MAVANAAQLLRLIKSGTNTSVAIMKAGTTTVVEVATAFSGAEMLERTSSLSEP